MTKNLKYTALCLLVTFLAIACSSDGGDSSVVTNPNEEKKEIGFKVDVWKMAEATRATTYDNTTLQSGGFKCTVYDAGTATVNTDANINGNIRDRRVFHFTFSSGTSFCIGKGVIIHFSDLSGSPPPSPSHPSPLFYSLLSSESGQRGYYQLYAWNRRCDRECGCC